MAIKQRKQITGTTEQINAYAGVEGLLVWDKTKKKLVGMSGTAGINYPMASESHTHSIANISGLQTTLDGKASATALTEGLAGKANASHMHTTAQVTGLDDALAGKSPTGHTHTIANVTNLQTALDGKANSSHTHTVSQITDMPNVVLSVNNITPASGGNVNLGLHAVATSGDYNDLSNRPSIPATPKAYVTTTWRSGAQWYRRWSDGWLEQGGRLKLEVWTGGDNPNKTFSLPTAFSNATYTTVITGEGEYGWADIRAVRQTTSSVTVTGSGSSTKDYVSYVHFYCSGY